MRAQTLRKRAKASYGPFSCTCCGMPRTADMKRATARAIRRQEKRELAIQPQVGRA